MAWFHSNLGMQVGNSLPATHRRGVRGYFVGNPHGNPATVLVQVDGIARAWDIAEITLQSPASDAWLAGYLEGFKVDVVDLWREPMPLGIELDELDDQVETSCRLLSMTRRWSDPQATNISLTDRRSPSADLPMTAYRDDRLLGAFLTGSEYQWWTNLEWHRAVEATLNDATGTENPAMDETQPWSLFDIIVDRAPRLAGYLAVVGRPEAARIVAEATDIQPHRGQRSAMDRVPLGISIEHLQAGRDPGCRRLARSRNWGNVLCDGDDVWISSVIPADPFSAWWLRGYLAGREPSRALLADWADDEISHDLWRVAVAYHHLTCAGIIPNALDRLRDIVNAAS